MVTVLNYQYTHQPHFEALNRQWIEKYFWMEPVDVAVLQHPDQHILAPGGHILMAEYKNEIAGTVALKFVSTGVYEFTKMAVDENYHGLKIGKRLAEAAIEWCRNKNTRQIILYSNTKLVPAISLYRKLGFQEVPLDGPYKRSDIKMQLDL
ncbi:MAG TPA: GNAT family N-acetyltransferase [Cyclobacteriaceae bacterium]|nr:GNAT family N-acetyltransferase [Cyclobacteriaceae bacterium]